MIEKIKKKRLKQITHKFLIRNLVVCILAMNIPILKTFAQTEGLDQNSQQFITLFDASGQEWSGCYRIPSLIAASNGDLICAVDERVPSCQDLRGNPDINIVSRRSTDNGNTWSKITTVVDYPPGKSASDPSMIVDKETGTIFLFFNFMDLDNAKNVYRLMVMESTDNGISWGAPEDITIQITKPEWKNNFMFVTSGRGIQTRSGKLVHTLVNLEQGLHLFVSDDHGDSWHLLETPVRPSDESRVVERSDGSWMINSRVNNYGARYIHRSSDQGKTWTSRPDSNLSDPGCNAGLVRLTINQDGLEKDCLLFSNANSANERKNLTLSISYDDGQSWPVKKTVYPGSAAYSSLTVLLNGEVGLLFEKDEYSEIVFVRFPGEWLVPGNEKR